MSFNLNHPIQWSANESVLPERRLGLEAETVGILSQLREQGRMLAAIAAISARHVDCSSDKTTLEAVDAMHRRIAALEQENEALRANIKQWFNTVCWAQHLVTPLIEARFDYDRDEMGRCVRQLRALAAQHIATRWPDNFPSD